MKKLLLTISSFLNFNAYSKTHVFSALVTLSLNFTMTAIEKDLF